jgi:hypothetical protein
MSEDNAPTATFEWSQKLDAILLPYLDLERANRNEIKDKMTLVEGTTPSYGQVSYRLTTLRKAASLVNKQRKQSHLDRPSNVSRSLLQLEIDQVLEPDHKVDDIDSYPLDDLDEPDEPDESDDEITSNPVANALAERLAQLRAEADEDDEEEEKTVRKRKSTVISQQLAENWIELQQSLPSRLAARFGKELAQLCDHPRCRQQATHKCFRGCPFEKHLCTDCATGPHKEWCPDHLVRRWNEKSFEYEQVEPSDVVVAAPK